MLDTFIILSVFLPLFGFLSTAFMQKEHKNILTPYLATLSMFLSLLSTISIIVLLKFGCVHEVKLFTWFKIEHLKVNWAIFIDSLSLVMLLIVSFISTLVHVYSFGYMAHDKDKGKFFGLLSFFTFCMNMLITGPNLLQIFFGWEGVGLASYLLIGFWFQKIEPPKAAMKAFIVNRIGDVGLILAIGGIFYCFETIEVVDILSQINSSNTLNKTIYFFGQIPILEFIAFGILLAAMGKSAQFGLHIWLPDAMEGPTPVSALIHAATMVTAGIFLICRFSPLMEMAPYAKNAILLVGTVTCFFAASVAIVQTDIKRIIAYSTCSQLGYMMMACGTSAYSVAMFHLITHAFFKALLFLGAGSVIHAMSGEQNIFKMGGLLKLIPFTFVMMVLGSLALSGLPFFAGYYSKEAILHEIYGNGHFISFGIGLVVVFLTAFYSWRLIVLTFNHTMRNDEHVLAHVHESPKTMTIPLFILSIGAIFSGYLGEILFIEGKLGFSWGNSLIQKTIHQSESGNVVLGMLPIFLALIGIIIAYFIYIKGPLFSNNLAMQFSKTHKFLYRKWYIDEIYKKLIVNPLQNFGAIFYKIGESTIDSIGADGFSVGIYELSKKINTLSTHKVYNMIAIVAWFLAIILFVYIIYPFIFPYIKLRVF
jgi:NADH-quinone oxidoreductase subunit L